MLPPMAETWFVLRHRPGAAVAGGSSVFEHPGFAEHGAFLRRRAEDGTLVGAGPLPDTDGEGMTVLRGESLEAVRRLAEEDDGSVVAGVLAVDVQPWQVMMTG